MKKSVIRFNKPASDTIEGWENMSLMIGNGFMGANVFSGVKQECIVIDEHTLSMPPGEYSGIYCTGNECFEKIYIDFEHDAYSEYKRQLELNTGIISLQYKNKDVKYTRECFASYPDKCMVFRIEASEKKSLSFTVSVQAPYIRDYLKKEGDRLGRSGFVKSIGDEIFLNGVSEYFNIEYEAVHKVFSDGEVISDGKGIIVKNASCAYIIVAVGTNYKLTEDMLDENDNFLPFDENDSPHEKMLSIVKEASKYSYEELKQRHIADFSEMYSRTDIDLGGTDTGECTDLLIEMYRNGTHIPYLEELQFNMGKYLLISSSRKGGYPCALQGIWNYHKIAPWTDGYWYNINIQMNYWCAFEFNIVECIYPYFHFNKMRMKAFSKLADKYIKENYPNRFEKGKNGWIVGTGNGVLYLGDVGGHSGIGTGGLTTKAYLDYYEFTQDKELLKNEIYPVVEGMTRFCVKCVKRYEDVYLAENSYSPEQLDNGKPYKSVGCAFDQQMIYENNSGFLKICEIIGYENVDEKLVREVQKQIDKYEPVLVGKSGQIKEYREESCYGDIGEKHHRHISQLVGLYPGSVINENTPKWLEAAKVTLDKRGTEESPAWSKAHKAALYARALCADRAYECLKSMICKNVFCNMWSKHSENGVFQIDGNMGASAAYIQLLLQSSSGFIHIFPSLPKQWKNISFQGFRAREGFEVSAALKEGTVNLKIKSLCGKRAVIRCRNLAAAAMKGIEIIDKDTVAFDTEPGIVYEFLNIKYGIQI